MSYSGRLILFCLICFFSVFSEAPAAAPDSLKEMFPPVKSSSDTDSVTVTAAGPVYMGKSSKQNYIFNAGNNNITFNLISENALDYQYFFKRI